MPTPISATQKALYLLIIITVAIAARPAFSQGQDFDPTGYLQHREFEQKPENNQGIQYDTVTMGGIIYHKFESGDGAIYVPKLTDLTEADFEKALCANVAPKDNPKALSDRDKAVVAKAEENITEKVQLFAQLITVTIHKKCGEPMSATEAGMPLSDGKGIEVGAKVNTGTKRRPSSTTIFNTNLAPNIGVRNEF